MKWIKRIASLIGVFAVSGFLIYASTNNVSSKNKTNHFPAQIDFSGEKVPLSVYDVRERLDREILINENLHSSTILIMKRANKAFPVIEDRKSVV